MAQKICVASRASWEGDKVKGSRFIGVISPAQTPQDAQALADELWAAHPEARHVCWAFRGEGPDAHRWADDGEPTGTAGRPILNVIDGVGLSWVVVAVVRYFGGTKLGTGGLARAYSEAAKGVLSVAELTELTPKVDLEVSLAYTHEGSAKHLLESVEARINEARYDTEVHLSVTLDEGVVDEVCATLTERTAGRARLTRSEVYFGV